MKVFNTVMKVVAALAAVAGVVYVVAPYGDKIVAWAKKLLGKSCCDDCACADCECNVDGERTCDCDCDDCECNDCTEASEETEEVEGESEEPACDTCEEVTEAETVEATEKDFEA